MADQETLPARSLYGGLADQHWKEVMELAERYGFIAQAYGGSALLLTHRVQLEQYGERGYLQIQRMNGHCARDLGCDGCLSDEGAASALRKLRVLAERRQTGAVGARPRVEPGIETGKEICDMQILGFYRQRTAGWEGVIYRDDAGQDYITNGLAVWDDSEKRRAGLERVECIDLDGLCQGLRRYQLNDQLLKLLQALSGAEDPADRDYLARPLLKELTYKISPVEGINISRSGGIVAQAAAPAPLLEQKKLLEQYQRVLMTAKARRACVSYCNHLRRRITKEWKAYLDTAKERDRLFQQLLDQAHLLQMRGIHMGYSDDAQVQRWNELYGNYEKTAYRNSPVAQMLWVARTLSEWEREFQTDPELGGRGCRVYL